MSGNPRIVRFAAVMVWSATVWVALWSDLSLANVVWGLVIGAVLAVVVPTRTGARQVGVRPLALLRFAGYFVVALVQASALVAWEVITPGSRINEGIVATELRTRSPGVVTLIANAISLTPGTLTLEVHDDPPTLYVHILHLRTVEQAREDIRRLEDLAIAAFPGIADPAEEPS